MNLSEALESFLETKEARLKPSSLLTYEKAARYWARALPDHPSVKDVELEVRRVVLSGTKPATINWKLSVLRQVWPLLYPGVALDVPGLQAGMRAPVYVPNDAFSCLMKHATRREKAFLIFARGAGLRHDEVLHLQWQDVCLVTGEVRVRAKEGWSPKSHHDRTSFVPKKWLPILVEYKETRAVVGLEDWVFCNYLGRRLRSMQKQMKSLFRGCGIYRAAIKPTHALRHAFATEALKAGANIETVRRALGHADISTTQRYLHATPEDVEAAANAGVEEFD